MTISERIVVDTNVLISRLILPESICAKALGRAESNARLLISEATMYELADVLSRPKFDRYVTLEDRKGFVERLTQIAEIVPIIQVVRECRDPSDDKFLEVALNGRADVIITGDEDLLAMNPWRGIAIVSAKNYLSMGS
jgi:putative PIN family toxin of toxin-antitoxin system